MRRCESSSRRSHDLVWPSMHLLSTSMLNHWQQVQKEVVCCSHAMNSTIDERLSSPTHCLLLSMNRRSISLVLWCWRVVMRSVSNIHYYYFCCFRHRKIHYRYRWILNLFHRESLAMFVDVALRRRYSSSLLSIHHFSFELIETKTIMLQLDENQNSIEQWIMLINCYLIIKKYLHNHWKDVPIEESKVVMRECRVRIENLCS